jgi:hypothetical protein
MRLGQRGEAFRMLARLRALSHFFRLALSGRRRGATGTDSNAHGTFEDEFNANFFKRPLKISQGPIMGHTVPCFEVRNRARRHFRKHG